MAAPGPGVPGLCGDDSSLACGTERHLGVGFQGCRLYRLDRGMFWRYAGPVVGGMYEGQQLSGGGRVLGACSSFGVSWREGGRPRLEGGGCA